MDENSGELRQTGTQIKRAATILCGAYAILLLTYFTLRLIAGERLDVVALGNSLMPSILIPALFGFILMLILRRWQIAVLLIPPIVVLAALYGGRFIPRGGDDDGTLSVLTFNVASQRSDFDALIGVIRNADADVVALQELLTGASDAVVTALSEVYPYAAMHPTDDFARGMGVLSKHPIIEDRYFDNLILGSQRIRLAIDDAPEVVFYNVHPVPPRAPAGVAFDDSTRSGEIAILLDDARQYAGEPVILAGDFNMTDQTDDYARVRDAGFGDTYRDAGFGFGPTFPSGQRWGGLLLLIPPAIRIDYVFHSDDFRGSAARVIGDSGQSDHYPVYVELMRV